MLVVELVDTAVVSPGRGMLLISESLVVAGVCIVDGAGDSYKMNIVLDYLRLKIL